jgi:predicted NBD/HSP70 family sugar kinase
MGKVEYRSHEANVEPMAVNTSSSSGRLVKAGPVDVRLQNRALVLGMLFPRENMSRADLSRETGLTRVAVSEVVSSLIEDGLVMESGRQVSTARGKRGTSLRIDSDSKQIVVLDLSQPNVMTGAITNLLGQIVYRQTSTIDFTGPLDIDVVTGFCSRLLKIASVPVLGIGVALPGTVSEEGKVLSSTSFGWANIDVASILHERTGLPVHVDNDANSAALAEKQYGGIGSDLIFVNITRGLGAGVIVGDKILTGADKAAGEIGHVIFDPDGLPCRCGKRGCLETVVSASVLEGQIKENPERREQILRNAGQMLGRALSMPVGMLNVPYVGIYGSLDVVNKIFVEAVQETLDSYVKAEFRSPVKVRRSELGDDIVIKGETAAVLRSQLGI